MSMASYLDFDPDLVNKYIANVTNEFAETQDEFIFRTISPFVDNVAGFSISKKELVEAVSLLRMKKLGLEKYGVSISDDWTTATLQSQELAKAYNRGFEDGVKKERNRIFGLIDKED